MVIEVLKKSVERFWQVVDFAQAIPEGVKIQTCVVTGAVDAIDHDVSIVEKGRALRVMVEKGGGGEFTLVCTLSDGQVVAQDVLVRVDDAVAVAKSSAQSVTQTVAQPIAKSPARAYTGHFTQPTNAAHADAFAVRAYGSGPDDKRVFRAKTAGLPVVTCPECDAGAQGERREVAVKELAISRNALSRGKMSRMANALRDGVREGDDVAAIKVAELHDGEGDGPRYAVLPGEGNHRVAHLMLSRKAGNVPVMVVPRKGVAKQLSTETPGKGAELVVDTLSGVTAGAQRKAASLLALAGKLDDLSDAQVLSALRRAKVEQKRLARAKSVPRVLAAAVLSLRLAAEKELKRRGVFGLGRPVASHESK